MIFGVKEAAETIPQLLDPTQPRNLFDIPGSLVGSAFYSFIAWRLIRLNEPGRKPAFWFVFAPLTGMALLAFIPILPPGSHFTIHPRLLGTLLFDSENNHLLSIIFIFTFLILNSMALFFPEQRETKQLFVKDKTDNSPGADLKP